MLAKMPPVEEHWISIKHFHLVVSVAVVAPVVVAVVVVAEHNTLLSTTCRSSSSIVERFLFFVLFSVIFSQYSVLSLQFLHLHDLCALLTYLCRPLLVTHHYSYIQKCK